LKYTLTGLDRIRMRPYFTAGVDILVAISRETPLRDESVLFTGTAPFDAPLIGGQIAQAPELAERGMPSGQGSIEAGFHLGTGIELRFSKGLSLNLDYRFTGVQGTAQQLHTASAALGFHW
jgi:opacity protein-like surface antigen